MLSKLPSSLPEPNPAPKRASGAFYVGHKDSTVHVTPEDLVTLKLKTFINGDVINAHARLANEKHHLSSTSTAGKPNTIILNNHTTQFLVTEAQDRKRALKLLTKEPIYKIGGVESELGAAFYRHIVAPVNYPAGIHWITLHADCAEGRLRILDSALGTSRSPTIATDFIDVLADHFASVGVAPLVPWQDWQVDVLDNLPQQAMLSNDCGLYSILFSRAIAKGMDLSRDLPPFSRRDVKLMGRALILREIVENRLLWWPGE